MPRAATKTEEAKAVRKLPASENGHGIHYKARNGREYCVSHCIEKERFTLWRIVPNGYIKMTSGDYPQDLLAVADLDK